MCVANKIDESAPTRQSLLHRLKNWEDQESWRHFFETYWRLIYNAAIRAGLTDAEAQDVVQDTVVSVAKAMPTFEYNQEKRSFKGWLLQLTSWRIEDQFRKRARALPLDRGSQTSTGTAMIDRLPDPAGAPLEAIWDDEWENHLIVAALERVKNKVDARQYQLFELCAVSKWPASKVAQALKVSPARVYLARHRIGRLVKKEVAQLRTKML
jgi:RNA polymerase sigma-70 factor (ECF subfamily)